MKMRLNTVRLFSIYYPWDIYYSTDYDYSPPTRLCGFDMLVLRDNRFTVGVF